MCALRKHGMPAALSGIFVLLAISACALYGCAPAYGYPNYPVYGYAPYSYGVGDRLLYQPEFEVRHPWEHHHDEGHHTVFYHGPEERAPHAVPEGGHPEGGHPQGHSR